MNDQEELTSYRDDDGCPEEMSVLRHEWRDFKYKLLRAAIELESVRLVEKNEEERLIKERDEANLALAASNAIFDQITQSLTNERDLLRKQNEELRKDKAAIEVDVLKIAENLTMGLWRNQSNEQNPHVAQSYGALRDGANMLRDQLLGYFTSLSGKTDDGEEGK